MNNSLIRRLLSHFVLKLDPWVSGLIDNLTTARLILNTNIDSRNRLALIVLDSALEVSFKNFLAYKKKITNLPPAVLEHREELHKIVKRHTQFDKDVWDKIDYFYGKRNNLYHEDVGSTLLDKAILDFFDLVIMVIDELFSVNSQALIKNPEGVMVRITKKTININKTRTRVEAIIVAMAYSEKIASSSEIKDVLLRMGYKQNITPSQINATMKSPSYRHYFYYEVKAKMWSLSDAGQDEYYRMLNEYGERIE